ncbi:hypothetical protein Talka_00805 [Tepidimonas alkaliphilus]|uniref:Lysylphosphatidylglycerol synthase TM region n=1 Tax=Tepidimonas alkaliphilus TaxID=2588942 RepID=A0A554WA55_9BURK|nr:lysylphosphatidylglycerol synthase transmembrane domain-containing protein [Tepidimonas alkaliphilus]TSE20459.1 hypothetical protein Talka_00805 [Tepidimonas alkaliphilus]
MRRARLLRLAASLGILAALLAWVGWQPLLQALGQAQPLWVLAGFALALLANSLCAWRWRALAQRLGHHMTASWAWVAYLRGQALNAVLPGATVGGDVWRAWVLHRAGMPLARASASVVLDRLFGLWALVLLGAAALGPALAWSAPSAAWPRLQALADPAVLGLLALATLLLALGPLALLRAGARVPWAKRPWWRGWLELAQRDPVGLWTQPLALSLAAQAATVAALVAAARALEVPLAWWWLVPAATPIFIAAALPVGLGGWGTREAAAVAVLGLLGVPATQAVALSVLFGLYPLLQAPLGLWPLPDLQRSGGTAGKS